MNNSCTLMVANDAMIFKSKEVAKYHGCTASVSDRTSALIDEMKYSTNMGVDHGEYGGTSPPEFQSDLRLYEYKCNENIYKISLCVARKISRNFQMSKIVLISTAYDNDDETLVKCQYALSNYQ